MANPTFNPFAKPGYPDLVTVPVSQLVDRVVPFPIDERFIDLRRRLVLGEIERHDALIHRDGIIPFSDYRPRLNPWFTKLVRRSLAPGAEAIAPFVYAMGDAFVMSDDYLLYYTLLHLGQTWIPCEVLGEATGPHVFTSQHHTSWDELDAQSP